MRVSKVTAWVLALILITLMTGVPFVYYRYTYTYGKRLRPVDGRQSFTAAAA